MGYIYALKKTINHSSHNIRHLKELTTVGQIMIVSACVPVEETHFRGICIQASVPACPWGPQRLRPHFRGTCIQATILACPRCPHGIHSQLQTLRARPVHIRCSLSKWTWTTSSRLCLSPFLSLSLLPLLSFRDRSLSSFLPPFPSFSNKPPMWALLYGVFFKIVRQGLFEIKSAKGSLKSAWYNCFISFMNYGEELWQTAETP